MVVIFRLKALLKTLQRENVRSIGGLNQLKHETIGNKSFAKKCCFLLEFFWEASNVQSNPVGERLFRTQCLLGCASTASCRRESPAKYGCNKALLSIGSSVQQKTSLERFLSECLFKKLLLFRELLKPYSSSF